MPIIQETIQKVREFAELPEGWHFGEGMPLSQARIDFAVTLLEFAEQFDVQRANAFPGIAGQVEITFYNENRMLEITLEADDSITIAEDKGREQVYFEENRSRSDAFRKIEEFSRDICPTSDLFIENTMTLNVRISQASPSTSKAGSQYPLWIAIAPSPQAAHIVHISHASTVSRQETRQFTGRYQMLIYQATVPLNLKRQIAGMIVTETFTGGEGMLPVGLLRD